MKRTLLLPLLGIALLVGLALLLYLLGRAPSRYVVETDIAELQQRRRETYIHFQQEIAKAIDDKASVERLRRELDARLLAPVPSRQGGWEVVYLPLGARKPDDRESWTEWGEVSPALRTDAPELQGAWKVWMRPATLPARLASKLR